MSLGKDISSKMNKSYFQILFLTIILFGIYLIFTRNTEIGLWILEITFIIFIIICYIYIEKVNKKTPPI
jgi:uncharacterized protein (DUF983 family)